MRNKIALTVRLFAHMVAFGAIGSAWGEAETVDGYTWTYRINNGRAEIYKAYSSAAISPLPTGAVTIPDTLGGKPVTSIGYEAFSGCSGLTSVTIPDSVTSIGYEAFYGCSGLTSVTIGNGVTSIGLYAFTCCSSLISFTVEESNAVYMSANGLLLSKDGKTLMLGVNGDVMIPDSVTSIGDSAFESCGGLTSVTIPDSVVSIENRAFLTCSGLTSVTIPDSVTSIGSSAFHGCTGLTSVTIGNGVTSIGDWAFRGCSGLTSVTIPDSVMSIGSSAFHGCTGLTSVTIGNGVTSIGGGAFDGCSELTSVTIPDSVTSIGDRAFEYCSRLTSVTIPDGVKSIGSSAFYYCSGLTSITIPNSVTSIGDSAFSGCRGLKSVTIGNGVTSIGSTAFSDCIGLTSVTIPNSVTKIGSSAFSGCSGLEEISIPFIGARRGKTGSLDALFGYIFGMSGYTGGTATQQYSASSPSTFYIPSNLKKVIVTDDTMVGNCALYNCSGLTSVTIPDSVTSIGDCAFYNCSGLTSVTIPDSVTSIGDFAFYNCSGLTSVTIPDSVTNIGDSAFYNCSGLTSVTILNSAMSIAERAFEGCAGVISLTAPAVPSAMPTAQLSSVTILDSVTSIGYGAFSGCSGLTSVTIPDSVTNIGDHAFSDCWSLTSVTIPGTVTSIGYGAFSYCDGLTSVTIPDSVTSIGGGAFSDCGNALYDTTTIPGVKLVDGWAVGTTGYLSGSLDLTGIRGIGDSAFYNCSGLMSVAIGNGVTSIGNSAFYNCSDLTSVAIGNGVTSIGYSAFEACGNLVSVVFLGEAPAGLENSGLFSRKKTKVKYRPAYASLYGKIVPKANFGGYLYLGPSDCAGMDDESWNAENAEYDDAVSHDGFGSLRIAGAGVNSKTGVSLKVNGSGRLSFWWKASSEYDAEEDCIYDYGFLSVDGVLLGTYDDDTCKLSGNAIGGATDWLNCSCNIEGEGEHMVVWSYKKDGSDEIAGFDDCIWLDEVTWEPVVCVSFQLGGGTGIEPETIVTNSGSVIALPSSLGLAKAKHRFAGWSDGNNVYAAGENYTLTPSDVTFTAQWMPNTISLPSITSAQVEDGGVVTDAAAVTITLLADDGATIHYTLDGTVPTAESPVYIDPLVLTDYAVTVKAVATRDDYFDSDVVDFSFARVPYTLAECLGLAQTDGVEVSAGGDGNPWHRVLEGESHDGVAGLRSGAITHGQTNWVEIAVNGPGTCSFWWKASSEIVKGKIRDGATFFVDGQRPESVAMIGGTSAVWTQVEYFVLGEGTHVLRWAYSKSSADGADVGEDCAWLDDVVWTPKATVPTVAIDDTKMETPVEQVGKRVIDAKEGQTLTEEDVASVTISSPLDSSDITEAYVKTLVDNQIIIELATPVVESVNEEDKVENDPSGMLADVEPEQIEAIPTPEAGEAVGALPVKTYPGLYYQASWGDDLGDMTTGVKVQATGEKLYLGVIKQTGDKGFYKISVSEE